MLAVNRNTASLGLTACRFYNAGGCGWGECIDCDDAVTATPTSDPRIRGGGVSHIVYMYITCFGIILIVLVLTIILRCIRKLQKKAQLARPTIYRNRSSQGQHLVTQELDEFQSSDKARLV